MSPKLPAILGAILLAIPAGSASGTTEETPDFQVGDIEHVASVGGFKASDIEFASREVTRLSDGVTGDPVCQKAPDGTCLVDAEGKTIYETEVRDFAVLGGYGTNARIIDITDPRSPVLVGQTPCSISQNDIQIQGDLLLVAQDGTGETAGSCRRADGSTARFNGSAVLDFSDPRNPTYLSRLQYVRGSHNHTFVPGKPIVYLSDSDVAPTAGLGNIPVWDLSDPANPVKKVDFAFGVHSPHDITFNESGTRAYVAAVTLTYILNTEDPFNPQLVSVIPNEGISISHQADPTPDGDYLLVSDELGGGAAGVSPGGPVHVYDIRNEARPIKVGVIEADCVPGSCFPATETPISTAHVFRINPDGYTMSIAWYKDGIHVIDFSSIRGANVAGSGGATKFGARTIGAIRMPGALNWAAKMWERHPGYVFTTDHGGRGLDVFYVASMGPGFLSRGSIGVGNPAPYTVGVGATKAEFEQDCELAPRTNGVDGWVTTIPAAVADEKHILHANAVDYVDHPPGTTRPYDLDVYLYDKDCTLLAEDEDTGTDESALIVEGSAYALTVNYRGQPLAINLSVTEVVD